MGKIAAGTIVLALVTVLGVGAGAASAAGAYHLTDLGAQVNFSIGTNINNNGLVVGLSDYGNPDGFNHAASFSNGSVFDLGTLGGVESAAYGVNARGDIVGGPEGPTPGVPRPFLYRNGTMLDLGSLAGISDTALAINNRGVIVG